MDRDPRAVGAAAPNDGPTYVDEQAALAFAEARSIAERDPAGGGKITHRLFYTPELQRRRQHDPAGLPGRAGRFFAAADRSLIARPGGTVACYRWPGTRPARVLLVHGWTSQAADWLLPARALLQAGFTVTAYDHPAHGASEGQVTSLPDCVDALGRVLDEHGPFDAVFAHSGGGAILATMLGGLIAAPPSCPARLALLAPPRSLHATMTRFADRYGLAGPSFAPFAALVDAENGRPAADFQVAPLLAALDTSVLHIIGTNDEEIPASESAVLRRTLSTAGTLDVPTDHAGMLASRAVAKALVAFAAEERAARPVYDPERDFTDAK